MTKNMMLAATLFLTTTAPAFAQSSIVNNFDSENGGASALNYNNFSNLLVGGSVDLVGSDNPYGIVCSGSCVDLDGTANQAGALVTDRYLSFNAGDLVTLSFDFSGNQRNNDTDMLSFGFVFDRPTLVNDYTFSGTNFGSLGVVNVDETTFDIPGALPFFNLNVSFRAGNAGEVLGFIATTSADNVGPIIDNFGLSVAAVPEPASWAMMIAGVGVVGGSLRRRSTTAKLKLA